MVENGPKLLNDILPEDIRVLTIRRTIPSFHSQKRCDYRTYSYTLPTFAFAPVTELTTPSYRLSDERRAEVNDVLKCFVGTHNFYNYTSRREHSDMSSNRYIIDFTCSEPFLYTHDFGFRQTEFEFATIYIKGQSFMMHQIRKMIGMTLTILRGFQNKSDVARSFESARMDVPRAPGLGLILEQVHYHNYDKTYSNVHPTLDTFGPEIEEEIKKIRQELVIKEILQTEAVTNQMMIWLSDMIKHDFQVDPESDSGEHHGLAQARAVAVGEREVSAADEDDDESQGPGPSDDAPVDEKVKEQAETDEPEKVAATAS
uniref:Pseudouridine synthase I TruA alpha/beta domain-containing protein n=1 Tax=Panagrolaimus sp. JU765 TaxID=591449 RepID=A0AC34Q502_9BILA